MLISKQQGATAAIYAARNEKTAAIRNLPARIMNMRDQVISGS